MAPKAIAEAMPEQKTKISAESEKPKWPGIHCESQLFGECETRITNIASPRKKSSLGSRGAGRGAAFSMMGVAPMGSAIFFIGIVRMPRRSAGSRMPAGHPSRRDKGLAAVRRSRRAGTEKEPGWSPAIPNTRAAAAFLRSSAAGMCSPVMCSHGFIRTNSLPLLHKFRSQCIGSVVFTNEVAGFAGLLAVKRGNCAENVGACPILQQCLRSGGRCRAVSGLRLSPGASAAPVSRSATEPPPCPARSAAAAGGS